MKANWIALFGRVEVTANHIKHVPFPAPEGAPPQVPFTLARSNLEFENGTISFETQIKEPDSRCQLGFNHGHETQYFLGLNVAGAAYGIAVFKNGQWEPAMTAGLNDSPPVHQWIAVKVRVVGSLLELYVNEVRVCSYLGSVVKSQAVLLFQGSSEILVRNFKVESSVPECFVVMQFTEEFNVLYEEVIRPTCESFGFRVIRADDSYTSGLIIDDITRSIREASVVIADITPDNPNVFYEVGYAHGIGKPTILLSDRKRERLPFDVSGFRTLFYDNTIGGKSVVEEKLRKHLENISA